MANAKVRWTMSDWPVAPTSTCKTLERMVLGREAVGTDLLGTAADDELRAGIGGRTSWEELQYLLACM